MPVAAVGYQFSHSKFREIFFNISKCDESKSDIECFVLDNDAYIIASKELEHTGKFFGEIRGSIMKSLVLDGIYDKIEIFDYQAMCFDRIDPEKSIGNIFKTVSFFIIYNQKNL